MTIVWVLLSPLILVVGLAAVVSALFVLLVIASELFGGPFSAAERRVRRWRALRGERRELNGGRWTLIERARDRLERYRGVATFGPIERTGRRSWRVATEGEDEVFLLHRGLTRVVRCGREEMSVADWLDRLAGELFARTSAPIAGRVVEDLESLREAIREANAFLPRPLAVPASPAYRDVMAAVGARAAFPPVHEPERAVLEARFADFCEACGYEPSPDAVRRLFPHLDEARSWLAGSRLRRDLHEEDEADEEGDALQLYIAGDRWVLLRFSFEDPWIVGDYPHPAAYAFDAMVRPALAEYERESRLMDPLLSLR